MNEAMPTFQNLSEDYPATIEPSSEDAAEYISKLNAGEVVSFDGSTSMENDEPTHVLLPIEEGSEEKISVPCTTERRQPAARDGLGNNIFFTVYIQPEAYARALNTHTSQ